VPTDHRLKDCLIKIGCPTSKKSPSDIDINTFLNNNILPRNYIIYIGCKNCHWGWNHYGKEGYFDYNNRKFKFMGNVNIEDWEVNLLTDTNKFNL